MTTSKEDRRVKFSKLFLKNSLIDLLETKSISKITIKEICEHADINRATFYAHFSDQYDLLKSIEEDYIKNILKDVDTHVKDKDETNTVILTEGILIYIYNNAKMSRILLSNRGDIHFQQRIMELVHNSIVSRVSDTQNTDQEKAQYISAYVISGCVGIIQAWFENGLRKSPREVAEIIGHLVLHSLAALDET